MDISIGLMTYIDLINGHNKSFGIPVTSLLLCFCVLEQNKLAYKYVQYYSGVVG